MLFGDLVKEFIFNAVEDIISTIEYMYEVVAEIHGSNKGRMNKYFRKFIAVDIWSTYIIIRGTNKVFNSPTMCSQNVKI